MKKIVIITIVLIAVMYSCKSENEDVVEVKDNKKNEIKFIQLDLKENKLITYSFKDNKIIHFNDNEMDKNTKWDIAFLGMNGKTNGGVSGNGGVKVFRTHLKEFNKIKSVAKIVDSQHWKIDEFLETKQYNNNSTKSIKGHYQSYLVENGWYSIDDKSFKIEVLKSVFILKNSDNKYVKLQFLEGSNSSIIKFKWEFLTLEGSDELNIYPHMIGEEVITGVEKVKDLLVGKNLSKINKLTIVDKILSQTDLNYIRDNFPKIDVLDLTHSSFSLQSSDKCLKDSKNIAHVILPTELRMLNFGRLGYSNIKKVTFSGDKLTTIGNGLFSFSKINELKLPNSLKNLENGSFAMIPELKTIEIPTKVSIIPDECFALSLKLESITFKGKIRTMGDRIFSSCKNLTSLRFLNETPPKFNTTDNPFYKDANNSNIIKANSMNIYVPKGSIDVYLNTWKLGEEYKKYFKEI